MDKRFQWTSFYMELASALLKYKNNRSELISILKTIFSDAGVNFPFKEKGKDVYEDICPFTVFGSFNKKITKPLPTPMKHPQIIKKLLLLPMTRYRSRK